MLLGFGLLLAAFILRGFRTANFFPKTGLGPGIALFLISAIFASWISFDQESAYLQFARILAAVVLFYTIIESSTLVRQLVIIAFVLGVAILAIYWPIQHNFGAGIIKFELINSLGQKINNSFPPSLLSTPIGSDIQPNSAGITLALGIPFAVYLTWDYWKKRKSIPAFLFSGITILLLAGLLLTSSRGSWLSLITTTLLVGLVIIQRKWFSKGSGIILFWGSAFIIITILITSFYSTENFSQIIGNIPDPTGTIIGRTSLWRNSLTLIPAYFFTGSGLTTFKMVYPTYATLTPVPVIFYSHNSVIEIWIQQGVLAVIALILGAIAVIHWGWNALSSEPVPAYGWAGLVGICMVVIHSMIDVTFYVGRTLPLLGMILGFAYLSNRPAVPIPVEQLALSTQPPKKVGVALTILLFSLILFIFIFFYLSLMSVWYANLGSLLQTRGELKYYDSNNFTNLSMDQIRRSIDLSQAERNFNRALNLNGSSATALHRVTQIEMSRREFSASLEHMQTAWDSGHRDDVTRLLYSDTLVADGQPNPAAEIVRGLSQAENRLMYQAWYRYRQNQDYQRAVYAWQTVLLLNPHNQQAQQGLKEIQKRLDQQ
ncbi:O-antigen ligase family protein [Chloroflexota bacterium]